MGSRFRALAAPFHLAARSKPGQVEPMLDWSECPAVESQPGKVSGAWLFKTTRVPVLALFQNLEDGATVDEFLEWFPGVTRGQVGAVPGHTGESPGADDLA